MTATFRLAIQVAYALDNGSWLATTSTVRQQRQPRTATWDEKHDKWIADPVRSRERSFRKFHIISPDGSVKEIHGSFNASVGINNVTNGIVVVETDGERYRIVWAERPAAKRKLDFNHVSVREKYTHESQLAIPLYKLKYQQPCPFVHPKMIASINEARKAGNQHIFVVDLASNESVTFKTEIKKVKDVCYSADGSTILIWGTGSFLIIDNPL